MRPIGRLHVITDNILQGRYTHLDLAALAIEGGAEVIQYRRKDGPARLLLAEASSIRELCRRKGVPLIVNDRVDIALAADADGVHLGADDLPLSLGRDILGPHRILGASADNGAEAVARAHEGADYVGIGPIFPTSSKGDTGPVLGIEGLARAVEVSEAPLIAIGGIGPDNLATVLSTGVHGVAILSAVALAEDPVAIVAWLREIFDRERGD